MIIFNEADHSYKDRYSREKYISVTQFLKDFKIPYDEEYWLRYKACEALMGKEEKDKDGKYKKVKGFYKLVNDFGIDYIEEGYLANPRYKELIAEIKESWDTKSKNSTDKGTAFHELKEKELIEAGEVEGLKVYPRPEGYDNSSRELVDDGVYPEFLIFNKEFRLAGQIDKLKKVGKNIYLKDYKGLDLNTPIFTTSGWKSMKEITTEDFVYDGNGKPTKVKHVSEIHYNPCFEIKFDTNNTVICDHEHKWVISKRVVHQKNNIKIYSFIDIEMTTEEIFFYIEKNKNSLMKKSLFIKNTLPIENVKIDLPIDPYLLGIWLGDGNRTCSSITCNNPKTWEEIRNRGYNLGENHYKNKDKYKNKAEVRTVLGISKQLKELNLIKNKHLPEIYLLGSYEQRLDLLRGFMDADGYLNKKRKRFVMVTTSFWQAEAIQQIVSSLGWKATIIKAKTFGFGKKDIDTWHVTFKSTKNPFLTRNQDCMNYIDIENNIKSGYKTIRTIKKVNTVPTKCIAVESPDKTYLFGKSFIKTHNTNEKLDYESFKHVKMLPPFDNLDDCSYNHYTIQLSLYGYMLEEMGFTVKELIIEHNGKEIPVKFLKKEVVEALKIRKGSI